MRQGGQAGFRAGSVLPGARGSPRLIARYGYASGFCSGLDEAPELVGDSKSWVWTAMVQPGLYHGSCAGAS